jgi:hypothetical protein
LQCDKGKGIQREPGVIFIGVSQALVPMISCVGCPVPEAFECGENHRFFGKAGNSAGFVPLPGLRAKEIKSGDIRRTQKARSE